jgi:hypothetical protein
MRIAFGKLMASFDVRITLMGVPPPEPALVNKFVPGWRTTPLRPGSMVNVIVDGATPVFTCDTSAEVTLGTL